jgi:hypothetical protein
VSEEPAVVENVEAPSPTPSETPQGEPLQTEPHNEMEEAGPETQPAALAPTETEGVTTPEGEPLPPPPLQATTQESLAEQIFRESHEFPDSQNPTDIVPNRPMIRPPQVQSEAEAAEAIQAQAEPNTIETTPTEQGVPIADQQTEGLGNPSPPPVEPEPTVEPAA